MKLSFDKYYLAAQVGKIGFGEILKQHRKFNGNTYIQKQPPEVFNFIKKETLA